MCPTNSDSKNATALTNRATGTTFVSSMPTSSLKRRGHQHHPRFAGTRRPPAIPNIQEILNALYCGDSKDAYYSVEAANIELPAPQEAGISSVNSIQSSSTKRNERNPRFKGTRRPPVTSNVKNIPNTLYLADPRDNLLTLDDSYPQFDGSEDNSVQSEFNHTKLERLLNDSVISPTPTEKVKKGEKLCAAEKAGKRAEKAAKKAKRDAKTTKRVTAFGGGLDEGISLADDDDMQWAQLRCTSEASENMAVHKVRRTKGRCTDYPGLAFGSSVFSSDTMIRFSIIRNELHNIMKTQLKRSEYEVSAWSKRVELLDESLERWEERLGSATAELSEASQAIDARERARIILENRFLADEEHIAALENQLKETRFLAAEAD